MDLFGTSNSNPVSTNQQVGAEGNSGPVFGAITIKGNKSSVVKQTKAEKKAAKLAAKSGVTPAPETTSASSNGSAGDALSSGAGNLNISVVSADANADNNLASIAGESIAAQNELAKTTTADNTELAGYSIAAQNNLALATLAQAGQVATASIDLAAQNNAQTQASALSLASMANQSANSIEQAGENFAALNDGANPNQVVAPISQDNSKVTNFLLVASIAVTLILIFKK